MILDSTESSSTSTPPAKRKIYNTKNPDSPRQADFPDKASYTRAYQAYFRQKNPGYLKNWLSKPENAERYTPSPIPQPPCHRCGSEKEKCEDGYWRCRPCTDLKDERKKKWLAELAERPALVLIRYDNSTAEIVLAKLSG